MKFSKSFVLLIFISFFLQGCLGNKNEIKKDVVFLQSSPVCTTEKMCNEMWEAAGEWVDKFSPQGIEVYSDTVIHSEERELGSDEMEIVVTKMKLEDGSHKIVIDNRCDRSLADCSVQRNNMIAFNKKLTGFMSVEQQEVQEKVFNANQGIDEWLAKYVAAVNTYDAKLLSKIVHFPVTYIEKNGVKVVINQNQLNDYLKATANKFIAVNGQYIKSESIDIFQRTERSIYVNTVINLYDIENTIVAAQQVGFHLVNDDGQLLMISAAVHTE